MTTVVHTRLGGGVEDVLSQAAAMKGNFLSRAFKNLISTNEPIVGIRFSEDASSAVDKIVVKESVGDQIFPKVLPAEIDGRKIDAKHMGDIFPWRTEHLYRCLDGFLALAREQDFQTKLVVAGSKDTKNFSYSIFSSSSDELQS